MRRLKASIVKECLLILHDKVGLLLMYLMPTLLVFIITIVQNSAFELVSDNKLNIIIVNKDRGSLGDSLVNFLAKSGNFSIEQANYVGLEQLKSETIIRKKLLGIYISEGFTENMNQESSYLSNLMLRELGATEEKKEKQKSHLNARITIFYDPVMQENYRLTINNGINTAIASIENSNMIRQLFNDMGYAEIPKNIKEAMSGKPRDLVSIPASLNENVLIPNSTQHNVPAWSLFAMFFMVISLGGNVVKERLSGSFVRLQSIPSAFLLVLISKIIIYIFVAITQLLLLFSIGIFVFPHLGLPPLNLPSDLPPLIVVSLLSALSAISYALLVGMYAKTQEQSNGFGAISIIIFAAIGGIWVPTFIMPQYLQTIAKFSPLHWCIEGYYRLFLKNGAWTELSGTITYLLLFSIICHFFIFIRLRSQNYI
jgi:ABC-2 type transport system permease protein